MTSSFSYSEQDFILKVKWDVFKQLHDFSKFDLELRTRWDEAMSKGHFRYNLSELETRIPDGKYRYLLQLNCRRAIERRSPQSIVSLNTPFDASRFNFTRVPQHEILFSLQHSSEGNMNDQDDGDQTLVMINVSPLEYGHILLVPEVNSCLPQDCVTKIGSFATMQFDEVLTLKSIELSLNLVLLSAHPGFRIGFNSLCALASVNHLHLHAWYLDHELYTESAPVQQVHRELFELLLFPARGFVLQLHNSSVECLARRAFQVVDYLQRNEVAHNLFITRGTTFHDTQSTVRIYIWPRESVLGKKADTSDTVDVFNVAVCELAGHLPIYISSKFQEITEEYITDRIKNQMLPSDKFDKLRSEIVRLLFPDQD